MRNNRRLFAVLCSLFVCLLLIGCSGVTQEITEGSLQEQPIDYDAASIEELVTYANGEDAEAAYRLGRIYDYGLNEQAQNFEQAFFYYQKSDALDNPLGSLGLGYLYLNGCGTDVSLDRASACFQKAADAGISEGLVGLGRVELAKNEPDADAAYALFSEAFEDENCVDAAYYLGYCTEKGIGTTPSNLRAIRYYQGIASHSIEREEEKFPICAANTRLGILYYNGAGVEEDMQEAKSYFMKAADDGYAMAQYYLGVMEEVGYEDEEPDYEAALAWYELAASKEYAPALNQLGCLYCKGLGVDVNYEQAHYYQKRAAAQGYAPAQINLGYLYENGLGTPVDLEVAESYYFMAEQSGYPGADTALERVGNLLEGIEDTAEQ